MNDQQAALILRVLSLRTLNLTEAIVRQSFNDWEIISVERQDELVGVVLRNGPELHIIIDSAKQNTICFRDLARKVVGDTIAKYNYAKTKVAAHHTVGHRLAKILKFKQTYVLDGVVYYVKED
jgi:hypothetical protein